MQKLILLIALARATGVLAAPCENIIAPALAQAFPTAKLLEDQPSRFDLPGEMALHGKVLACRTWPGNADLTLIAVALDLDNSYMEAPQAGLDILVVDSANGALRARRHDAQLFAQRPDPSSYQFDAFDAARYPLAPNQLAVGIRVSSGGHAWGEGSLRLYLRNDDKLDQIAELVTSEAQSFRGFGRNATSQCRDLLPDLLAAPDIKRTVAIGPASSHGLSDLIVSETRTPHTYALECRPGLRPVKTRYTVKFDGKQYVK